MTSKLFSKVFGWMFIGLLLTFIIAFIVASNKNMLINIFNLPMIIFLCLLEVGLVVFLSARITKLKTTTARILFIIYSFVSGLTFSFIFIYFEIGSIIFVFLLSALVFGIFALLGYLIKLDLTKLSTYLLMALIGVIICFILNMFIFHNSMFEIGLIIISLIVFLGFTAYDIQKIKKWAYQIENEDNLAILGALNLYLDFINIFIDLIRLIGTEK